MREKASTPSDLIKHLRYLEDKVEIFKISENEKNLSFLDRYLAEHELYVRGMNSDPDASSDFNTYLQKKLEHIQNRKNEEREQEKLLRKFYDIYKEKGDESAKKNIHEVLSKRSNTIIISESLREFSYALSQIFLKDSEFQKPQQSLKDRYLDDVLIGLKSLESIRNINFKEDFLVIAEISGSINNEDLDLYSEINQVISKGDFSGCRFTDISFKGDIRNSSFRDCVLENVTFDSCDMEGVDFRGANFKKCSFDNYWIGSDMRQSYSKSRLRGMQFDFHNIDDMQNIDAINIEETNNSKIDNEIKTIKKYEKFLNERREEILSKYSGFSDWVFRKIVLNDTAQKEIEKEQEEGLKLVQKEWKKELKNVLKEQNQKWRITPPEQKVDATYIPGDTNTVKIVFDASASDLNLYLNSEFNGSFTQFIANKTDENKAKMKGYKNVIPVVNLKDAHIENFDFSGKDLSRVIFANARIYNCRFDGANLSGSSFEKASFSDGTSFKKAICNDSNFMFANLRAADFTEAFMARTRMINANMYGAILRESVMYSADVRNADLRKTLLENVSIEKSNLEKINLRYADAQYVNLRNNSLKKANLDEGKFNSSEFYDLSMNQISANNTVFIDSRFENVSATNSDFKSANMDKIKIKSSDFTDSDFSNSSLINANIENSSLNRVNAEHSNMSSAKFSNGTTMKSANLSYAVANRLDAAGTDFTGSIFKETQLLEGNLDNAKLNRVVATQANFSGCSIMNAELKNSIFDRCKFNDTNLSFSDPYGSYLFRNSFSGSRNAEAFELLQNQIYNDSRLLPMSRYGDCPNEKDGSNSRFECQKLGLVALITFMQAPNLYMNYGVSAIVAQYFTGLTISSSGQLDDVLKDIIKILQYSSKPYLDNVIGDRLAELGAISISIGAITAQGVISDKKLAVLAVLNMSSSGFLGEIAGHAARLNLGFTVLSEAMKGASNTYIELQRYNEKINAGKKPEDIYKENLKILYSFRGKVKFALIFCIVLTAIVMPTVWLILPHLPISVYVVFGVVSLLSTCLISYKGYGSIINFSNFLKSSLKRIGRIFRKNVISNEVANEVAITVENKQTLEKKMESKGKIDNNLLNKEMPKTSIKQEQSKQGQKFLDKFVKGESKSKLEKTSEKFKKFPELKKDAVQKKSQNNLIR